MQVLNTSFYPPEELLHQGFTPVSPVVDGIDAHGSQIVIHWSTGWHRLYRRRKYLVGTLLGVLNIRQIWITFIGVNLMWKTNQNPCSRLAIYFYNSGLFFPALNFCDPFRNINSTKTNDFFLSTWSTCLPGVKPLIMTLQIILFTLIPTGFEWRIQVGYDEAKPIPSSLSNWLPPPHMWSYKHNSNGDLAKSLLNLGQGWLTTLQINHRYDYLPMY